MWFRILCPVATPIKEEYIVMLSQSQLVLIGGGGGTGGWNYYLHANCHFFGSEFLANAIVVLKSED